MQAPEVVGPIGFNGMTANPLDPRLFVALIRYGYSDAVNTCDSGSWWAAWCLPLPFREDLYFTFPGLVRSISGSSEGLWRVSKDGNKIAGVVAVILVRTPGHASYKSSRYSSDV